MFQLERHIFRHELRVDFRRLDLNDVDVNFFAGHSAQFFLQLVDFRPFAANHYARPRGQNRDAAAIRGAELAIRGVLLPIPEVLPAIREAPPSSLSLARGKVSTFAWAARGFVRKPAETGPG